MLPRSVRVSVRVMVRLRKRVVIWKRVWIWVGVSRGLKAHVMKLQYYYRW